MLLYFSITSPKSNRQTPFKGYLKKFEIKIAFASLNCLEFVILTPDKTKSFIYLGLHRIG